MDLNEFHNLREGSIIIRHDLAGSIKFKLITISKDKQDYFVQPIDADLNFFIPTIMYTKMELLNDNFTTKLDRKDGAKKSGCECGAGHTSFKNHHLDWCPLFT